MATLLRLCNLPSCLESSFIPTGWSPQCYTIFLAWGKGRGSHWRIIWIDSRLLLWSSELTTRMPWCPPLSKGLLLDHSVILWSGTQQKPFPRSGREQSPTLASRKQWRLGIMARNLGWISRKKPTRLIGPWGFMRPQQRRKQTLGVRIYGLKHCLLYTSPSPRD